MTPGSGSWSRISFGSGAGAPTRTHGAVVAGEHAVVTTRPCSALSARPPRLRVPAPAGSRSGAAAGSAPPATIASRSAASSSGWPEEPGRGLVRVSGRARDRCKLMEVRQGLSRTSSRQSAKSSRLEAGCARHFPGNGRLGRGSSPSQSPRQRGVRPASAAFLCGIRRNRTGDLLLAIDGGWLTTLSSTACRHSTDLLRGTTER